MTLLIALLGYDFTLVKNALAYQFKQKIGFILNAQNLNDFDSMSRIHKTSFSLRLTNEPNKLECLALASLPAHQSDIYGEVKNFNNKS